MPRRLAPAAVPVLALLLALAGLDARAATFDVDNLDDDGPGSLRQAIRDANDTPGADTILFGGGLMGTIELSGSLPFVSESVEIIGPGAERVTIDGNQTGNVFSLNGGDDDLFELQGLTVTGGEIPVSGGGAGIDLERGQLVLEGMRIVGNVAATIGGGVAGGFTTTITVRRSVVAGNEAGNGAGISGDTVVVESSAIYANDATFGLGGGIFAITISLFESTVSGNRALGATSNGGGIFVDEGGSLTAYASTIVDNRAVVGGAGLAVHPSATITDVSNVVIANNLLLPSGAEADCSRDLGVAGRVNLSSDTTCGFSGAGDLEDTHPQLAPLELAGGPTPSHVPFPNGPVVDAGLNPSCLTVDQRGFARPVDGDENGTAFCDLGAVEYTPGVDGTLFGDGFESGDTSAW